MSRVARATALATAGMVVALPLMSCGGGSDQRATTKSAADVIRDTERARIHALVMHDMRRARALHADDFVLSAPTGDTFTKQTYLDGVGSGRFDYVLWQPISPMRVRLHGDEAKVEYRSKIAFAGFGKPTEQTHHDTYARRRGRWLIVRSVTVFDS
jgi:hypothetical protein